jgi:hypothetical protein
LITYDGGWLAGQRSYFRNAFFAAGAGQYGGKGQNHRENQFV